MSETILKAPRSPLNMLNIGVLVPVVLAAQSLIFKDRGAEMDWVVYLYFPLIPIVLISMFLITRWNWWLLRIGGLVGFVYMFYMRVLA